MADKQKEIDTNGATTVLHAFASEMLPVKDARNALGALGFATDLRRWVYADCELLHVASGRYMWVEC